LRCRQLLLELSFTRKIPSQVLNQEHGTAWITGQNLIVAGGLSGVAASPSKELREKFGANYADYCNVVPR
jgi:hypothetical protein